jgi:hypothetical protein
MAIDRTLLEQAPKDHSLQEVLARNVSALITSLGGGNPDRYAFAFGLAPETLRSILNAKNDVRLSTVKAIANRTGTRADRLIADDYDPASDTPPYLARNLHGPPGFLFLTDPDPAPRRVHPSVDLASDLRRPARLASRARLGASSGRSVCDGPSPRTRGRGGG